jgi:hypothetical protein
VELWARNVQEFCLNAVTFRDLLHAVKLRHGTDCFTFLSEGRRDEDFDVLMSNILFMRVPNTEKCDVTASNGTHQSANSRRGHMM